MMQPRHVVVSPFLFFFLFVVTSSLALTVINRRFQLPLFHGSTSVSRCGTVQPFPCDSPHRSWTTSRTITLFSTRRNRRASYNVDDENENYDTNNYYDDDDNTNAEYYDDEDTWNEKRKNPMNNRKRYDYDIDDDDDDEENSFFRSPSSASSTNNNRKRGGVYKVTFDDDDEVASTTIRPSPEPLEWEVLHHQDHPRHGGASSSTTYILLPPSHVEKPTAVIHLCGATWFGSAPHVWYNSLCQALVRQTSCAVIATSIPITLWRNPLQHKQLAMQLQRNFIQAWQDVILDEYYYDVFPQMNDDDEQVLPPVIGLGHSLGARLLVILATLSSPGAARDSTFTNTAPSSNRRQKFMMQQQLPPPYQSLILMSFTNYGASVGIPGIQALWQQSRKLEQRQLDHDTDETPNRRQASRGRRPPTSSARRRRQQQQQQRDEFDYDDDDEFNEFDNEEEDEEDLDWRNVWKDVMNVVGEQATRVQSLLTPRSDDLEVYPTPDQLWKALTKGDRYNIPQTLLIQFDDDPIDQSSKLAHILLASNTRNNNTTTATETESSSSVSSSTTTTNGDIKFCRLRGSHLTPIFGSSFSHWLKPRSNKWPSRATKALWKLLQGKPAVDADVSLMELRQSVARYILDVVVVKAAEAEAAAVAAATLNKKS
jgi:hypothetical protein